MNSGDNSPYDLIAIGGGAAGFFASITCAELSEKPRRILILEKSSEVLQKVKISGGGRCNVTHHCEDLRKFVEHYPRGSRSLPGPLHHWGVADMIKWLSDRGVETKVESDGRMFPISDDSQTIIDCFLRATAELGIEIQCKKEVTDVSYENNLFKLEMRSGASLSTKNLLIATGGTRTPSGAKFAEKFGHSSEKAAPSLFTFKIKDPRIEGLAGISVLRGTASVKGSKFSESGPILITHWGLSGPGILKLSARGARALQEQNYQFETIINWVSDLSKENIETLLLSVRTTSGKQLVFANPQCSVPSRLWKRLCEAAQIAPETKWGNLRRDELNMLVAQLTAGIFKVEGKSMNKDEFVTCGGITLSEVNFKTMESKLRSGLYFAGEVLDIDGVTGGFNFQSAWTTARIAGSRIAL